MRVFLLYIQLRYKLLPYLYNLFCDQEEFGDPILRPLAYEFESTKRSPLDFISDQFLVGPSILQAPILEEHKRSRKVLLPGREPWLNANNGEWIRAQTVIEAPALQETPLYFRHGAI